VILDDHRSAWGYSANNKYGPKSNQVPIGPQKPPKPQNVFLSENCTAVLAQTGSTPIMHCEVGDVGEGTVSLQRHNY
jgi:hypothetical protein